MADLLDLILRLAVIAFIVSSMLGVGLGLSAILAPLRDVRFVLRALLLNFILAPAFAWLLTVIIPLQTGYTIGLLLIGGAGGAPFLPTPVKTARRNLVSSVALMTLLTIGTLLFMPFALPFMIPGLRADAWTIARPLLLLIVVRAHSRDAGCGASSIAGEARRADTHRNWQRLPVVAFCVTHRAQYPFAAWCHR